MTQTSQSEQTRLSKSKIVKFQHVDFDNVDQFFNFEMNTKDAQGRNKKQKQGQVGRWTYDQHRKYIQVIKMQLGKKQLQKKLLQHIPTRSDSQIRAHHQKMLKKYKTLSEIEKTDIIELPGIKDVIPRLDKIISLLQQVTDESFEPLVLSDDFDLFQGVESIQQISKIQFH